MMRRVPASTSAAPLLPPCVDPAVHTTWAITDWIVYQSSMFTP